MSLPRLLVVDDDLGVQESLRMLFKDACEVTVAGGVDAALAVLEPAPDAILLDLVMPGRNGLELLGELRERGSATPVVVLTATKTLDTAVEAMKLGAADYVTKPFEIDSLRIKVRRLLEQGALRREVREAGDAAPRRDSLGRMIGRSEPMQQVFRTIERVAGTRATVLVTGESGTGKELAAGALHELSPRRDGPLVAINCAALPETLIESELFGHERGAFTDARDRRIGKFESAQGGTLFLDEIGELPPTVQAKLLRTLEERRIERLGGGAPIDVDVRLVAATHRHLPQEIARGRFREDLFYRINVVQIDLPPLRERGLDVRLLAQRLLERVREDVGRGPREISPSALAAIEAYPWPGNVRELANAIERALALAEGEVLEVGDLPDAVTDSGRVGRLRDEVRSGRIGYEEAVARFESELLREALDRCGWNQTRAAEQLGITRRLLKIRMDKLGIEPA